MRVIFRGALYLCVFLCAIALLAGCSKPAAEEVASTLVPTIEILPPTAIVQATMPVQTDVQDPPVAPTVVITTPSVASQDQSPVTGNSVPGRPYKPVIVMVENSKDARPQSGVGTADIVYETYVEGSTTRFMLLFNDFYPEKVGPCRSVRMYHIDIGLQYDPMFVHFGAAEGDKTNAYARLRSNVFRKRIDGMTSSLFWRASDRAAPHNAYINLSKTVADEYPQSNPSVMPQRLYADAADYAGTDVSVVKIPYTTANTVTYRYNRDENLYARYIGDVEFKDQQTGQVKVRNIVVQYVEQWSQGTAAGHLGMTIRGEGTARFFVAGKMIEGTWKYDSAAKQTIYYDNAGAEMVWQRGNTYFQIVPKNMQITAE